MAPIAQLPRRDLEIPARKTPRAARAARIRISHRLIWLTFLVIALLASVPVVWVSTETLRTMSSATNGHSSNMVAKISRPMADGTFCHNVTYDNESSQTIEDKVERCDGDTPRRKLPPKTLLNWYAK